MGNENDYYTETTPGFEGDKVPFAVLDYPRNTKEVLLRAIEDAAEEAPPNIEWGATTDTVIIEGSGVADYFLWNVADEIKMSELEAAQSYEYQFAEQLVKLRHWVTESEIETELP